MKMFIVFILLWTWLMPVTANGAEADDITEALRQYNLEEYDAMIKREVGEINGLSGLSYSDIIYNALSGQLDLSFFSVLRLLFEAAFKEVILNGAAMRVLIITALLGAIMKTLVGDFSKSTVNEIEVYIVYVSLVSLLITTFVTASQIASGSISKMASFMQALIPLIMALLVASGRYAVSFVFHPAAMAVSEIAVFIIDNLVLNIIMLAAVLQMVNFLTPAGTLDNLTDLVYDVISYGLKGLAVLFMAFISIEAAAAPIAGGIIGKGAKTLVSAVPVVGGAISGAVDSVFYWGTAVKNAAAIAALICVIFICLIPVVKLLAIVLLYRFTAALMEPFADDRITSLISVAGKYVMLFAIAVICVCAMFIALLMMVMAAAIG